MVFLYEGGIWVQGYAQREDDMKRHRKGLSWWFSGEESALQCKGHGFDPWSEN